MLLVRLSDRTLAMILTATNAPQYRASHTSPKEPPPTSSMSWISEGETSLAAEGSLVKSVAAEPASKAELGRPFAATLKMEGP